MNKDSKILFETYEKLLEESFLSRTYKGAAKGALGGALMGAGFGAMTGGVGAIPGAIAGAKTGGVVGAGMGAASKEDEDENAEGGSWDPMTNLAPKAQQIHNILSECGDDELTPEQCEKAADIIIGGPNEWEQQDYVRMLKGLSFVLQKMCITSMN